LRRAWPRFSHFGNGSGLFENTFLGPSRQQLTRRTLLTAPRNLRSCDYHAKAALKTSEVSSQSLGLSYLAGGRARLWCLRPWEFQMKHGNLQTILLVVGLTASSFCVVGCDQLALEPAKGGLTENTAAAAPDHAKAPVAAVAEPFAYESWLVANAGKVRISKVGAGPDNVAGKQGGPSHAVIGADRDAPTEFVPGTEASWALLDSEVAWMLVPAGPDHAVECIQCDGWYAGNHYVGCIDGACPNCGDWIVASYQCARGHLGTPLCCGVNSWYCTGTGCP
jgi:hypothetical protein